MLIYSGLQAMLLSRGVPGLTQSLHATIPLPVSGGPKNNISAWRMMGKGMEAEWKRN